jgi:malate dehydrogenase (oxaloacetate-decarboxylating)(NADP+)
MLPRVVVFVQAGPRITKKEALDYHIGPPPGKLEVIPTKPAATQRDLSLAYTPGVAEPCREIHKNPDDVFRYTNKGNLVAVVTNGTAVLGLGNIGALASKPVMEGKGVLFKRIGGVDVFDIELDTTDVEEFIRTVRLLEPTFGGINLEDLKAPDCFIIEERLRKELEIPVFHDDQHGTAIISGGALLNALELVEKDIADVTIVMSGAGAAAIACAEFYITLGAKRENITLVDSRGVVYKGREEGMNEYKARFAVDTEARTLAEAMVGADVFIGLSVGGLVSKEMVQSMASRPVIFAMANPDPEIGYWEAKEAVPDAVVATGRSDYPNQVNNVLGFPFIFRGALDVRAKTINEPMKIAAARALSDLAREDVPDSVLRAYGEETVRFGPDYIIPKPLDPRALVWVASAVAQAAIDSGVARREIDIEAYRDELKARLGMAEAMIQVVINKAKREPKRIAFPEGEHRKILRAAQILCDEGIAEPVLIGDPEVIAAGKEELGLDFEAEVVDPLDSKLRSEYADILYRLRHRKGLTQHEAGALIRNPNYFGSVMVHLGKADGLISGMTCHYPEALRPALQVIGTRDDVNKVVGMYMMTFKNRVFFFADATVNIDPTAEDLVEIAIATARVARTFDIEPRVAMLSFSNFGSARHPLSDKVRRAVALLHERNVDFEVDGEMQADTAVVWDIITKTYPHCKLSGPANVLIFPDLEAANVAYKLLQRLADAEATGPILEGMKCPVHVLQRGDDVKDVVHMTAIAVVGAQELGRAAAGSKDE